MIRLRNVQSIRDAHGQEICVNALLLLEGHLTQGKNVQNIPVVHGQGPRAIVQRLRKIANKR